MTTKRYMVIGCLWLVVFAIIAITPFSAGSAIPLGFALGAFTFPFVIGGR